jgi:hypothetical protein
MRPWADGGGRACTLPGRGGGGAGAGDWPRAKYVELDGEPCTDAMFGKGDVMAAGLFIDPLGVRRSGTAGASFQPPFSRRLGGGGAVGGGVAFEAPKVGGGAGIIWPPCNCVGGWLYAFPDG